MSDKVISEILGRYDEPMEGNVWRVQNQLVIFHKTLERIAAKAGIWFDLPQIIRADRDEAVMMVRGVLGDRTEWSIGEALVNVNYRVSGRQAAYVYAMAEKRAKDRVILKLIGLHGLLYSEEEADDFKNSRPANDEPENTAPNNQTAVWDHEPVGAPDTLDDVRRSIDRAQTMNEVIDFMNTLSAEKRQEARDYAKKKLMALGWPAKKPA